MNMRNSRMLIIVFSFIVGLTSLCMAEYADSAAIDYYLQQVSNTFNNTYVFNLQRNFVCDAKATINLTNHRGEIDRADTAISRINYSKGSIVSQEILDSSGMDQNQITDMIIADMPWELDCTYYFFPRDTGGVDLYIGFESRNNDESGGISGYININRYSFVINSMTIFRTDLEFSDRYSRIYKFEYRDLLTCPVRIDRQWCKGGFWGRKFFDQTITFDNYNFSD